MILFRNGLARTGVWQTCEQRRDLQDKRSRTGTNSFQPSVTGMWVSSGEKRMIP
jgi:hypothetical protein